MGAEEWRPRLTPRERKARRAWAQWSAERAIHRLTCEVEHLRKLLQHTSQWEAPNDWALVGGAEEQWIQPTRHCEWCEAKLEPTIANQARDPANVCEKREGEVGAQRDQLRLWDEGNFEAKSQPDVASDFRTVYAGPSRTPLCEKRTAKLEPDTASLALDPANESERTEGE
eukprot:3408169-Pyramimonas_sp.AAC.1